MKKLTIENWKELQPYIALADYHEYNSNAMTLLMWSNRYEAYFETYEHFALVYTKCRIMSLYGLCHIVPCLTVKKP